MPRYVLTLKKSDDPATVGVKAYVLGILLREGFPVPDGFIINNKAYRRFLESNDIESKILDMYNSTKLSDYEQVTKLSQDIKSLILSKEIPDDVRDEISQAYKFMNIGQVAPVETIDILRAGKEQYRIIARPSVDSKFNFPGLFSYGYGSGAKRILELVKEVWAGLHNPDAILYREKLHINQDMDMCVIIQREIESEKSGVSITSKKTIIEATWGMNKTILKSEIQPDMFIINENTIEFKHIGKKKLMLIKDGAGNSKYVHSGMNSERSSLTDNEILKIISMIKKIESTFKNKIIIEWAIDGQKLYLLQCRSHNFNIETPFGLNSDSLVKGLPVSNGYTSGKIKFGYDGSKDIILKDKPVNSISMNASAVVYEQGSYGSSNALLCREMGVPALFGAENATKLVKENQKATLDCYEGILRVFENDEEIKTTHHTPQYNKGYWIDTPAAALTINKMKKDDMIIFDIEKVSRLMFASDYSEEFVVHESILTIIKQIKEKCDDVIVFWRKEPENYMIEKINEIGVKNIVQVSFKDII